MRSYSSATMYLNGEKKGQLDIWGNHNVFHVYEYDINVFTGSWSETVRYIDNWKATKKAIADMLSANIRFEQTIG